MRFPLIGSAVLFSLFLLFKVLPKVRAGPLSCILSVQSTPRDAQSSSSISSAELRPGTGPS